MSILKNLSDAVQGKATIGELRSSKWPAARAAHLKLHPKCAVCGGTKSLEVHHIVPFNIDPTLELNPTNFVTLCESSDKGVTCHLWFGHLGNYQSFNKDVIKDAKAWSTKLVKRPSK